MKTQPSPPSPQPRSRALLFLLAGFTGIALLFWFSPRVIAFSPSWTRYQHFQDEKGIDAGLLYYTDVPVTLQSERANRAAVEAALEERRRTVGSPVHDGNGS